MIEWSVRMGAASQIPKPVAAIKKCWPDGIVAEFETDESYFHEIHPRLERDLRNIRGAALLWQTEEAENGANWDEDGREDEPPPSEDWQSYHLFFLAPDGKEFHFEDETEGGEEPEDPEEEEGTGTTAGEGWIGCAVGICLAAPFAALHLDRFSRYEDGSAWLPDVESFVVYDETNERVVDSDQYYREILSEKAFQQLEELRGKIAAVLVKHRIEVLVSFDRVVATSGHNCCDRFGPSWGEVEGGGNGSDHRRNWGSSERHSSELTAFSQSGGRSRAAWLRRDRRRGF